MFQQVLDVDPDFVLPMMISPTAKNAFNHVKATYKIVPRLTHTPPQHIDASKGALLIVNIERMRPQYVARLFYRQRGAPAFNGLDLSLRETGVYGAERPPAVQRSQTQVKGDILEYYMTVTAPPAETIAHLRDAQSAFAVPVEHLIEAERPLAKRWWFWTVITGAVLVAGGATAAVIILTRPAPGAGNAHIVFDF